MTELQKNELELLRYACSEMAGRRLEQALDLDVKFAAQKTDLRSESEHYRRLADKLSRYITNT